MSEFRVGGAYVDLYLKGLEQYNRDLSESSKRLVEYGTRAIDLQKQQEKLKKEIASTSDKGIKNNLRKQLADIEKQIKDNEISFKSTNKEIEKQTKLISSLGKVAKKDLQIQRSTKNIIDGFDRLGNSTNTTVGHFNQLIQTGSVLKGVLTALSAKKLYDFLIEPNAELEQHLVQFNTLLGSMENAQRMMNDIIRIAKLTPFETNDVVQAVEILSQYGEAQEDLIPTFNKLADLSRGNAENLNNIALAYGRIKNSGKVTLRELNIMIRRGVPVMQAFSESTGKTTAELYKMIRAGELGVDVFENAINYLTTNGGRFEGLVAEQGKTLKGRISTLKDDLMFIGKDIGEAAFKELSVYIGDIIKEIEKLEATGELQEFTQTLGQGISDAVKALIDFTKKLYEFRSEVATGITYVLSFVTALKTVETVGSGISKLTKVFKTLGSGSLAVAGLVAALTFATSEITKINSETAKFISTSKDLIDENKRLTESYERQMETLHANAENAGRLTNELQTLMGAVEKSAKEHNRITDIVNELNNLYPELNLKYDAERSELNRAIPVINDYVKAHKELNETKAQDEHINNIKAQNVELEAQIKLIEDRKAANTDSYKAIELLYKKELDYSKDYITNIFQKPISGLTTSLFTPFLQLLVAMGEEVEIVLEDGTKTTLNKILEITNLLNKLGLEVNADEESLKGLYNQLNINNEILKSYGINVDDISEKEKKLNDILLQYIPTYQSISESIENLGKKVHQTFTDLEDGNSDLRKGIDDSIDSINELSDAIYKNGEDTSFTADEARNLISEYPELQDAIYKTADGYKFEEGALKALNEAKIESARITIESTISSLRTELETIDETIEKYKQQANALTSLAILRKSLAPGKNDMEGVGFKQWQDSKGPKTYKEGADFFLADSMTAGLEKEKKEIENTIKSYEDILSNFYKQIDIVSSQHGRNVSKSSKKDTETPDAEAIRNLKFDYDMGLISAKQYYDGLEKIKDAYYAEGSKDWQKYTLEIKQGREKAAEEEYKAGYDTIKELIEDEEHLDKLSKEQKIERLKELRQYIQNSYDNRLIDYEKYADDLRKIDKEIYTAQKEHLEDSIEELNNMRDKQYEAEKSKLEKYYDDIERMQEEAEMADKLNEYKELKETAQLYEGAVSRAGQQKLKDLQKDITKLEREIVRDEMEKQREYHLENLDAKYKALEENQEAYFETVQGGIKTTAEIVAEYTAQINGFFSQVNTILSTAREQAVGTASNLTITNNIYDNTGFSAALDMSQIVSPYGFK